ncbi:MAG: hypothetical protein AB7F99_09460 [Vicinamibacterales bacterium]
MNYSRVYDRKQKRSDRIMWAIAIAAMVLCSVLTLLFTTGCAGEYEVRYDDTTKTLSVVHRRTGEQYIAASSTPTKSDDGAEVPAHVADVARQTAEAEKTGSPESWRRAWDAWRDGARWSFGRMERAAESKQRVIDNADKAGGS